MIPTEAKGSANVVEIVRNGWVVVVVWLVFLFFLFFLFFLVVLVVLVVLVSVALADFFCFHSNNDAIQVDL